MDRGTDNFAEKGKRAKTEVPKDEKQRRIERKAQNTISRREARYVATIKK